MEIGLIEADAQRCVVLWGWKDDLLFGGNCQALDICNRY